MDFLMGVCCDSELEDKIDDDYEVFGESLDERGENIYLIKKELGE